MEPLVEQSERPARPRSGASEDEKPMNTPGGEFPPELSHSPEDGSPPFKSSHSPWVGLLIFLVCLGMHMLLVGVHLALVIIRYLVKADSIQVPITNLNEVTQVLFYYVTVFPNLIIKVYLVPLLYITQKLALRRDLHEEQTLTAMHDKAHAWLSLGATGVTVLKYRNLLRWRKVDAQTWWADLVAFGGVLCVLLYLLGGLLLGIFAPDLVTIGDVIGNSTDVQPITSYIPNIGQDPNQIQEAFPIVDMIPLLYADEDVITTGLEDNVVYDIPNFATEAQTFVNGAVVQASCQSIPGATQSGDFDTTNSTFPVQVHESLLPVDITPTSRTLNIRSARWASAPPGTPPPPVLILASTLPVVDESNLTSSIVGLNPTINSVNCPVAADCSTVSAVQMMACNIAIVSLGQNIQVFTDEWPIGITTNSSQVGIESDDWSQWTLPHVPMDPSLFSIGSLGDLSPPSHVTRFFNVPASGDNGNVTISMLEDNIMEALGYYRNTTAADLVDLEAVLEQSIAAIFWRAAVRAVNNATAFSDEFASDPKYSVKISKWTPWLGLVSSTIMMVVAVIMTRQPLPHNIGRNVPRVSGLGVLELTWLLGAESSNTAKKLAEVEDPTPVNLREEGKKITVTFRDL